MVTEMVLIAAWAALPLLAYATGGVMVRRHERRAEAFVPIGPLRRLEELRAASSRGRVVVGGRMAEAVRLAEDGAASASGQRTHRR